MRRLTLAQLAAEPPRGPTPGFTPLRPLAELNRLGNRGLPRKKNASGLTPPPGLRKFPPIAAANGPGDFGGPLV